MNRSRHGDQREGAFEEATLLVQLALKGASELGIEHPVLLGVHTSHGRIVVPVEAESTEDGPRFTDPEQAVAWIGLADRQDAQAIRAVKIAALNWNRARPQIASMLIASSGAPLSDLLEIAEAALRLGDTLANATRELLEGNPFDDEEEWG